MLRLRHNFHGQLFRRFFTTKLTNHQLELMARGLPKRRQLPNVEHIVTVASGKGGVGKSTVAVNLSVMISNLGYKVGLLDADISGPSVPLMMNVHDTPLTNDRNQIIPPINYGVKCLSMSLLTKPGNAVIWRGPLLMSAIQVMLTRSIWGPLDILIIDTPPGTGDIHLSLTQYTQIDGVLLVTTPQLAALEITARGANMYQVLNIPIFGLVENMAYGTCKNCKCRIDLWPNCTQKFADKLNTNILVSLPLENNLPNSCDNGEPIVLKYPNTDYVKNFRHLADFILKKLKLQADEAK